jgi:hypothetical protein
MFPSQKWLSSEGGSNCVLVMLSYTDRRSTLRVVAVVRLGEGQMWR